MRLDLTPRARILRTLFQTLLCGPAAARATRRNAPKTNFAIMNTNFGLIGKKLGNTQIFQED
ncbi:MAG: hypothetical protein KC593_22055, partial [Myxococcales bacterium]|nr:hypothetical protein [Myxococcales bacterium]